MNLVHRFRIFLLLTLTLVLFCNIATAEVKRSIGIMPVENLRNNKRYNWIGFAFEYLLSNKLSNISSFYVPDQKIIQRAFREGGYSTEKIDGQIVYHIGKATGINVGFIITYSTDGKSIYVNVNFINSFTFSSIF